MSFNDLSSLDSWQITASALGAVPLLGIFASNYLVFGTDPHKWWKDEQAKQKREKTFVNGQPSRTAFGIIWFLLLALVFLSVFIAAINLDSNALVMMVVFTMLFTVSAIAWLYYYHKGERRLSSQVLGLTLLWALCMLVVAVSSPTRALGDDNVKYANVASGLCVAPLVVWLTAAYGFNLVEINKTK